MTNTFELLSQPVKFSKEQALDIIQELSGQNVVIVSEPVAAYLCGYKLSRKNKSKADIEKEMSERARKHAKAVKFAKKKNLPTPEMDETPPEAFELVLVPDEYARNPKEDFLPQLKGMLVFPKLIKDLEVYQAYNVELRGNTGNKQEKDERALMAIFDKVYKHQGHVVRAWKEIEVNYQLGCNNVIFHENIKNYATFIAFLVEFQKLCNRELKSEPRLLNNMKEVFKDFDPKANWFAFALEESLTMCAGGNNKDGVPANLAPSKKLFWDTFKEASKLAKEFYSM